MGMREDFAKFQQIFSMAKITRHETVPDYLRTAMSGIVWDDWVGDTNDGGECNKFACLYSGGASFYFCFGRDTRYKSIREAPQGEAFQFCGLVANVDENWYSGKFTKDDLPSVKRIVGSENEDAIITLKLKPTNIKNPLAFIPSGWSSGFVKSNQKISIQKSPNADTRTAEGEVDKEELLRSTEMHISDVQQGLAFFADKLHDAGSIHDNTKISDIDGFYKLAQAGFKDEDFRAGDWFKKHVTEERHHLKDHCPDDVTLIDVLERIADSVMAGLARSGSVYSDSLDPEILEKAYQNTIELLKRNVEVKD